MIVLSMVLVVVGFVLLMLGVLGVGDSPLDFVYYSIGACLLAAVFLIVGVLRGRPSKKPVAASGGEGKDASWSGASAWSDGDDDRGSSTAVLQRDESAEEEKPRVQVVAAEDVAGHGPGPQAGAAQQQQEEDWAPAGAEEPAPAEPSAEEDVAVVPKASAAPRTSETDAEVVAADDVTPAAGTAKKASARKASAKKAAAKKATAKKSTSRKATASSRPGEMQKFDDLLSGVSGVGPAKRQVLAEHFGTYANLQSASVEDIAAIDGISEVVAGRIRNALNARGE